MTRRLLAASLFALLAVGPLAVGPLTSVAARAAGLASAPPHADDIPCVAEQEPNDQPEQAPIASGEVCLTGTLPQVRDQDLVLWDVLPAEEVVTWRFTMTGIPTTITSVWVYEIDSPDGVYPLDTTELFRVDSSATSDTPGLREGVALPAGRYLLAIARGAPADNSEPPPAEYRLTVEHEQALPPDGDTEPNDDATTATPLAGAFSLTGAIEEDPDVYRWTLSEADAAGPWQADLQSAQGDAVDLALQTADGSPLAATRTGSDAQGHLYDLRLDAGDYLLVVSASGGEARGYLLAAGPADAATWDPEPNDAPAQAIGVAVGGSATGRLAGPRDFDWYAFDVPVELDGHQFDVGIGTQAEGNRQVCLVRLADSDTRCRSGTGDVTLSNELLAPGDYRVSVDGTEDLTQGYTLAVSDVGPVTADREVEPNDRVDQGSPFDPALVMRGRSADGDVDTYRITVTGEAQVWRLDAAGTAIRSVTWVDPDGEVRGTADVSADGTRASLWDMALVPGDHWVAIETQGEDYTLAMTPLGPRAEGAEREPNNDRANAEPIDPGAARTGRLPGSADPDVYRFSLGTAEQVTVRLDPPADAAVQVELSTGTEGVARLREPEPGIPFVHRLALPAGDYEVTLQSASGSVEPYTLRVDREDPFAMVADLEPNDTQASARPVPPTLRVAGRGFGQRREDPDWYALPPLATDAPVTVRTTGGPVLQELRDATTSVRWEATADGTTWTTAPLPAGTALFLNVGATGDYTLEFESDGLPAPVSDMDLPIAAALEPSTTEVAAYTDFGQRIAGTLRLTGAPGADLAVTLDALTTHPQWSVGFDQAQVTVPAGTTVEVPLTIVAARDAWADEPVRVTVRARDAEGRQATTYADVTPRRDVALVMPEPWWPLPASMLGGLDVASLVMGASVPADGPSHQEELHDGVAMTGIGFSGRMSGDPLTLAVDLAGETPVPVAGFVVNPLSQGPSLASSPRRAEFLLSDDGATWRSVLEVELSPLAQDQAFALATPEPARFAQLRIHDTYGGTDAYVNLGEWQVIAGPDWRPGSTFDIAEPAYGGHVAWMLPGPTDPSQPDEMLSEAVESRSWAPWVLGGSTISWAMGFHDDRAAQVTSLEWVDGPDSDPALRFDSVDVAVSATSALGPWEDMGTWTLTRAADGSVAPFRLPDPTWVRFVRLSGAGPAETGYRQLPVTIRVLERPVDDGYRSILGAWGRGEPTAVREFLEPPDPSTLELAFDLSDGNDTPASATPLVAGEPVDARIRRGEDIDWYSLTIPPTDNILELTVNARPDAGLQVTLEDAQGAPVELVSVLGGSPGALAFRADVEPGATYHVKVGQPPLSTVFSYDTSGSMGAYLSFVTAALRGFAADVIPGEEAVLVMPFGDRPLLPDWSDDPYAIENAIAGAGPGSGSSNAEIAISEAVKQLMPRPGTKALLVVTDAETTSYGSGADMWQLLDAVRPIVFTVHVAGGGYPYLTTDLMQDWAESWGGHYEYASSHAQIDRAFDRLATWLRRPAAYDITYATRFVSHAPGRLTVVAAGGSSGAGSLVAGSGVSVEILLDTSGSMRAKTQGGRRIAVAKQVLTDLVNDTLVPGLPTALRIFTPGRSCESRLIAPLAPLDRAAMTSLVEGLKINKSTRTPIAATLKEVAADLGSATGLRIIVLITDGKETCKGDPEAVIRDLVSQGLDVRVNIVGFDIDDEGLREQMARWAEVGNGQAFDAEGQKELAASIAAALAAPYRVLDQDGQVMGTDVVGGPGVSLPPGTYRVEILTEPPIVFEAVEIPAETNVRLEVAPPGPETSPTP